MSADTPTVRPDEPLVAIAGERGQFLASFAQQRLWLLDQVIQEKEVYNVCQHLRVRGLLDLPALRAAFEALAARHESLRTSFTEKAGQPVQVIAARVPVELELVDLTGRPDAEREAEALRRAEVAARYQFDLTRIPLWRLQVVRIRPDDHFILWTLHHIITDAWSLDVLCRDLAELYEAATAGRPARLPELPVQYADFSEWQRNWLRGELLEEQLKYWKPQLAGELTPLQLPVCKPRTRTQTFRGAVETFDLPAATAQAVKDVSRRAGGTPFLVLLTAFQALLHRYSGQDDLCVGTPTTGRPLLELRDVTGFFVNTLVLRVDCSGAPSFRELMTRTQQVACDALAHQDVPFDRLVEELRPARDPSRNPLFQVMFEYSETPTVPSAFAGLLLSAVRGHQGTAMFDLLLTVEPEGDRLACRLEYNTDLFDADTIRRMRGHYLTLLESGLADPDRPVGTLPLLTPAERQQIVVEWNQTRADYPRDCCIHQLVEAQVARTPEAVAVVADGEEWTYRRLNERANRLAHHLRGLGVGPGVLVGVCLRRSAEMIIGVLGILKAGGAYVPLDPNYPADRLAFLLEDTQAPVILTQQPLRDRVPQTAAQVVCLDAIDDVLARQSGDNPADPGDPERLAYVIYTSGSTGKPKGVVLRHGPVVNLIDWVNKTFQVGAGDRLLFVTSLNFDLSVYDIFGILAAGATNRVASSEELRDPEGLLRTLCREAITFWDSAPPMLQQLAPFFGGVKEPGRNKHLRLVFLSGDWIPVPLPDAVRGVFPQAKVVSLGGATEAAIWSNYYRIGKVDPAWPSIPYGVPIQNARYHVLDPHLQPVPVGVPAELHIGGICLADGYLHRPELTAEKFVPDPFSALFDFGGTRLYKTGDLARYFPDGNLEFLGRIDNQVKVRGYRIELGEIEAVLAQHPAVREAVVVARKDAAGGKSLAGYVVAKPGQALDAESLRGHLKGRLPDYMVPTYLMVLPALPLNPNGKIDRKALPDPTTAPANGARRSVVAPRDDAERDLLAVWEEVLETSPVGVTDNFFDLGGHSFLAAVLTARIKQRLGHSIPLSALFTAPTVEKLARLVQHQLEAGSDRAVVPLQEGGSRPPLFLIAGVGGHVFTFHKFARLLGADQPVYGVKAIGVDGKRRPPDRMEEIAAAYAAEILEVCPQGPYVLGGYSVGAVVALELALQLRARGREVPLLVVFDMTAPGYPRKLPLYRRLLIHGQNFWQLQGGAKAAYVRERLKNVKERVFRKAGLGFLNAPDLEASRPAVAPQSSWKSTTSSVLRLAHGAMGRADDPEMVLKQVWAALMRANQHYLPHGKYDGRTLLVRAAEGFRWAATVFDDPLMGWGWWCRGAIEDLVVPGGHTEVFHEKNIGAVAAKLQECLRRLPESKDRPDY